MYLHNGVSGYPRRGRSSIRQTATIPEFERLRGKVRSHRQGELRGADDLGEESLRNGIREFFAHYHGERNYQGLENRLIAPIERIAAKTGTIRRRQRLDESSEKPAQTEFRVTLNWFQELKQRLH